MTKTHQRDQKRRHQQAELQGTSSAVNASWPDTVWIVDALFRIYAEQAAAQDGVLIEDALEVAWSLFERGCMRVVSRDAEHVGVEMCESRAEQRAQAAKNRRLVEFRRRMTQPAAQQGAIRAAALQTVH
jgi:hypothetical protein